MKLKSSSLKKNGLAAKKIRTEFFIKSRKKAKVKFVGLEKMSPFNTKDFCSMAVCLTNPKDAVRSNFPLELDK